MARVDQTSNDTQKKRPNKLRSRPRSQNAFGRSTQPANSLTSSPNSQPKSPGIRARGRKGQALASARDRTRLRERNVAERRRLEKMLATAPLPDDRRESVRDPHGHHEENRSVDFEYGCVSGLPNGCPVCGDSRIVTDQVIHGGTLSMSECLHCDHRWTTRPKARWVDLGARMNRGGRPRAVVTA